MINVSVASLKNADSLLSSRSFTGLVSIGANGSRHCKKRTGHDLFLDFHDVTPVSWNHGDDRAMASDIIHIIKFGRALKDGEYVLCQSEQGRSRSTAAAIILHLSFGLNEEDACRRLFNPYPRSTPNWLMLSIADHLLNTNVTGHCREKFKVKSARRDKRL